MDDTAIADVTANVVSVANSIASSLVVPALATTLGLKAFQFLLSKYQEG